jgi:hypothetical protein
LKFPGKVIEREDNRAFFFWVNSRVIQHHRESKTSRRTKKNRRSPSEQEGNSSHKRNSSKSRKGKSRACCERFSDSRTKRAILNSVGNVRRRTTYWDMAPMLPKMRRGNSLKTTEERRRKQYCNCWVNDKT